MTQSDDIIAACIILILSSLAYFPYVICCAAILRVRKATKNPFYYLLFALGVSDSTMLGLFLFYSTPATFMQSRPLGDDFDALFCGFLCNITYFTSLALLANIAFNRYLAICSKTLSKKVQDNRQIQLVMLGCIAFGLISAIAQLTPCCSLRYYQEDYTFGYDLDLDGNSVFVWYDRTSNMVTFITLTTCYGLVFRKVRMTRNAAHPAMITNAEQKQKAEVRLAIQSALVAGLMITFGLGFTIIPLLSSSKWWNLLSSILYIAAIGVHPFVYIGFNKQIRNQVIGLLMSRPISESVVANRLENAPTRTRSLVARHENGDQPISVNTTREVAAFSGH